LSTESFFFLDATDFASSSSLSPEAFFVLVVSSFGADVSFFLAFDFFFVSASAAFLTVCFLSWALASAFLAVPAFVLAASAFAPFFLVFFLSAREQSVQSKTSAPHRRPVGPT
jgi:hypothetical protein